MKIFVQVWCEIDPTLNVRIDRQSGQPVAEPGDQLQRVSPLGRAGVAAALQLGAGDVTAFALGTGHASALRQALAAGATTAVELAPGGTGDISPALLAGWFREQQADLVIADRIAGLLAARLGWSHLAGLDDLRIEAGRLTAVRFLGRGDREIVTARLPAAVRLQSESLLQPPFVSRHRLQAAAQRPIVQEVLAAAAAVSEPAPLQLARPRTRIGQAAPAPTATSGSDRLKALLGGGTNQPVVAKPTDKQPATPEDLAEEFVRYLVHHGLL